MASKTEKNIVKAMQERRKDEQKADKKATKEVKADIKAKNKKDKNKTGVIVASRKFQKAGNELFGLPAILWPFIILVSYQMFRNAAEKKRQKRDMEEAKRFLRESRGFR
jgi:hypothetical protein